jgi:hypothetical protein
MSLNCTPYAFIITKLTGTEHNGSAKWLLWHNEGRVKSEMFMHAEVCTILDWYATMIGSKLSINTA